MPSSTVNFYEMLADAIGRLGSNTQETRRAVYDEARQELRRLLAEDPAASSTDFLIDHQRALEAAVLDIEISALRGEALPRHSHGRPTRTAPSAASAPAEPVFAAAPDSPEPPFHPYASRSPSPAGLREPSFVPEPRMAAQRARPIANAAAARAGRARMAAPANRMGAPVRGASARPSGPGLAEEAFDEPAIGRRPRRVWPIAAVAALVLFAVAAAAWVANRDGISLKQIFASASSLVDGKTAMRDSSANASRREAMEAMRQGNQWLEKQDYDRAIESFSAAIRLDSNNTIAYSARGFSHWMKDNPDRAIEDYGHAIRLDPDNIIALANRAVAHNSIGEYARAIEDLDRQLKLQPADASAWNSRCWSHALAGQLEAAIADCNESLRLRPNDANTLDSRGLTYLKLQRHDRAIADYDAALRLDPKLATALYGRGLAKLKTGDAAGGNADITAARSIRPDIVGLYAIHGVN
jgi:Flp pilus assembly protein TadD